MYDQTPEIESATAPVPWNEGKLIGQKPPLTPKQIWGHSDSLADGPPTA
jgi:hypothetical protein